MRNLSVGVFVMAVAAASPAWADPAPPKPAAAAKQKPTKLAVDLAGTQMTIVLSPSSPASIGDERWSHVLAIAATDRSADAVTLHIATVPKADRDTTTLDQVVQQAKLKQRMTRSRELVIEPGQGIARDVFGQSPPKKIVVRWLAN